MKKRWVPLKELTRKLAEQQRMTMVDCNRIVDALFVELRTRTKHGEAVLVPDFGLFRRTTRKSRVVRDVKTGTMIELPATVSIGFRASKAVKSVAR